tara:strand:- start:1430 stop:1672 length:243 start_codon:yes stop_codon:yes gene_type:complete
MSLFKERVASSKKMIALQNEILSLKNELGKLKSAPPKDDVSAELLVEAKAELKKLRSENTRLKNKISKLEKDLEELTAPE